MLLFETVVLSGGEKKLITKKINELRFDDSGRIYLSVKERKQLGGGKVVIWRKRRKGELILYTEDEWSKLIKRISEGYGRERARKTERIVFAHDGIQRIDNKGRLYVSKNLRK